MVIRIFQTNGYLMLAAAADEIHSMVTVNTARFLAFPSPLQHLALAHESI